MTRWNKCGTTHLPSDRRYGFTWANALTRTVERVIMSPQLSQPSARHGICAGETRGENGEKRERFRRDTAAREGFERPREAPAGSPLWRGQSWWRKTFCGFID